MEIELLLKVVGVGMIAAVICQILKSTGKDEYSMLVSLSGIVIVFLLLAGEIAELIAKIRGVFGL